MRTLNVELRTSNVEVKTAFAFYFDVRRSRFDVRFYSGSIMQLAFSTNAYTRFSLIDALRGIKRAGFAGVEILADPPHAYPDQIDAALTSSAKREFESLDLEVCNINCNCSFGYWKYAPPEPYFEP